MRLVIAHCQVDYEGRLTAHLPMATRLLLVKADGSVSVHADGGAYKPLMWMSPPCHGVEAHLQELLAADPCRILDGLVLVRREHQTDIGPVDLLCRDADGRAVAIEIKRRGEIDGVEQLARYLEFLERDPNLRPVRGMFVAQVIKPQARALAAERGIVCVEVDYDTLRGIERAQTSLF